MTIKAIRMFDGGFISQSFAFGGEEGKEAFDEQKTDATRDKILKLVKTL